MCWRRMHLPQVTISVLQFYVGMLWSCLFQLVQRKRETSRWPGGATSISKRRSKANNAQKGNEPLSFSLIRNQVQNINNGHFEISQNLTACVLPDGFTWNVHSVLVQCGLGQFQQPPSTTAVLIHVLTPNSSRDRIIVRMYSCVKTNRSFLFMVVRLQTEADV